MPIFVKGDDTRNGTKANTHHGWLQGGLDGLN